MRVHIQYNTYNRVLEKLLKTVVRLTTIGLINENVMILLRGD